MHILIYVLDALRADHVSCYGYRRETSPNIDALSREGVLFSNCFTSSTWTRPVASSILTGTYPGVHMTCRRDDMFDSNLVRLPQILKEAGFKTAAFSAMGNVAGDIGFDLGFDQYYNLFRAPEVLAKRRKLDPTREALTHAKNEKIALPRADDINEVLFKWLDKNQKDSTFNFIWSIETHFPFIAPTRFRHFAKASPLNPQEGDLDNILGEGAAGQQRLRDLYDDEIHYNDYCIGMIVNYLKNSNIYDDTLFLVTSDHGEAFYEHGVYGHGHIPYDELIHVPLIIKFPHGRFAGKKASALVELIDIFATVIGASGSSSLIKDGYLIQGYDLSKLLDGTYSKLRDYTFSDTQSLAIHNRYLSVRSTRWKYIKIHRPKRDSRTIAKTLRYIMMRKMIFSILRNPRHFFHNYLQSKSEYLFDLENDPEEQHNLVDQLIEKVIQFREVLADRIRRNEELAVQVGRSNLRYREDEEIRKHLEELGYM